MLSPPNEMVGAGRSTADSSIPRRCADPCASSDDPMYSARLTIRRRNAHAAMTCAAVVLLGCKSSSVTDRASPGGASVNVVTSPSTSSAPLPAVSNSLPAASARPPDRIEATGSHDRESESPLPLEPCEALSSTLHLAAAFRRRPWTFFPSNMAVSCEHGVCNQGRAGEIGLFGVGWTASHSGGSHFFTKWREPANFRCESVGLATATTIANVDRCAKPRAGALSGMTISFDRLGRCMAIFDDAYERADPRAATPFMCDDGDSRVSENVIRCPGINILSMVAPAEK